MDPPNVNIEDFELNTFHTGTELHTAAVNGDKLTILKILEQDGDIHTINKGDKYGRTALVYTVFGDWFECADVLVRHEASLSQVDCDKRSVLHWAAYLNRPKFIKLFLDHMGNLECNFGDKDGRTALHYAAMQSNSKCLRLLLRHLMLNEKNLNKTDNELMTALHWSVFYNRLENFNLLTRGGADTKKRDAKGRCLLHMAVLNSNADSVRIVRTLLKLNRHFSRQVDIVNKHTSLHLAVANGNQDLVRELCQAEEPALNDLDDLSRSVLHYAVLRNDIELMNILVTAGVSPHHVDNTGATVLHYAAKNNNVQIVKSLRNFKNFEDTTDTHGRTALMWAASEGSYDVLKFMLENLSYFNIHASDEQGLTALHFACFAGHEKCVKLLIANSADINQPDKLGQTALFKACQQGHLNIIDILMDRKGSRGTIRNNSGQNVTIMDNDGHQVNARQGVLRDSNGTIGTHLSSIKEETAVSHDSLRNSEWTQEETKSSNDVHDSQRGEKGDSPVLNNETFPGNHSSHQPVKYSMKELQSTVLDIKQNKTKLPAEFLSERLPGIQELEDENGCTPLHFAAHAGHIPVCRWLLTQGVDPGKKDTQGRTALHGAAFNGHTECMALMLSHDPELVDDRDDDGYSILHHAAINGQLEAVKLLVLEPFEAFLNYRVKSTDWTPLDFAMAADHQDVTQFLMDNGALTIAWLQDIAADKIKKFLRRLVLQKREARVKPLIERHKQLTKEEHSKHCEHDNKITNDDVVNGIIKDDVIADVRHNDVMQDTRHDVMNSDVISTSNRTVGCDGNNDVIEKSRTFKSNVKTMDADQKSEKHRITTDAVHLRASASISGNNNKQTFMLDSCHHSNTARVQKLEQENVDVSKRDRHGCATDHYKAKERKDDICGEDSLENEEGTRRGRNRNKPLKNTESKLSNNKTSVENEQEKMNAGHTVLPDEKPLKNNVNQERATIKQQNNKTDEIPKPTSSRIQTKSTHPTSKMNRPTDYNPINKGLSENFSEQINSKSENSYEGRVHSVISSGHALEPRSISSPLRANSARSTSSTSTFVQSNIENLSRAPDSVIIAGGEKDRIFQLRNTWERIALLRRKKQAALVLQQHFRKYLASKRKADDKNTATESKAETGPSVLHDKCTVTSMTQSDRDVRNSGRDNGQIKISLPCKTTKAASSQTKHSNSKFNIQGSLSSKTDINEAKNNTISNSNANQGIESKSDPNSPVSSSETTSPKRLSRESVVNRLRTTSPEYNTSENGHIREKREYKSSFPLLSPKSSPTPLTRSPRNASSRQISNERRPNPSHSNRRAELPLSPKSSSTSSNLSPSNASVGQLPVNRRSHSSPSVRYADVAPILSKNELVNQWLSHGLVSVNSSEMKNTHPQIKHRTSISEPQSRKPDRSKAARRPSAQSARTRRDTLIKDVYGSPAVLSYNFALDTYHPLASRRGRKDTSFPFTTSGRVRPNSMKRVEEGWVHKPDFAPRSTPSEP